MMKTSNLKCTSVYCLQIFTDSLKNVVSFMLQKCNQCTLKKERNDTRHLGFIRGPYFTLCFKKVLQFLQRFLPKSRLENDQITYPYRLTTSVCRRINALCRNILDTCTRQTSQRKFTFE